MNFIDTHTHLFLKEFNDDRNQVIKNALEKGVRKMILPNVDSSTINGLIAMSEQYPDYCIPAMGLHPGSVNENYKKELKIVEDYLIKNKFCAVGEIGIDLYWDKTYINQQIEAFDYQIKLAKKNQLPIIIHTRNSFDEVFQIVKNNSDASLKGVFHSFTGNMEKAQKILDLGFYLGINGIITFKNSGLDKVVAKLPMEKILLETDSPYLTPTPFRGKRNESSYLVYIATKIAETKGLTVEQVAYETAQNSRDLFRL